MTIARKYFSHLLGVYAPKTVERVFEMYGKEIIENSDFMPTRIFTDGSYIRTYGGEVVEVDGVIDPEDFDTDYDPAEAYFLGFAGL